MRHQTLFLPLAALALALAATPAAGQSVRLASVELTDSAALDRAMPRLAEEVLAVYRNADRRTALDDRFRLELVAGRWEAARASLDTLHALRAAPGTAATVQARAANVQYAIYARARALEAGGRPFAEAFAQAFRETLAELDDRTAALVVRAFNASRPPMQGELGRAIERARGKAELPLAGAVALVRAYQMVESYRAFAPVATPLVAEDDARRYVVAREVRIPTPDGATVCALVVRPRSARGRLPALMEFTIYADPVGMMAEARRTASNGYVGVEALARGKACSPGAPAPYEHDGADAAAAIDWIAAQPWSDGRVGMYGGSYNGFTQWAATKHLPKALKAIMPSVPVAPGLDVPMEGHVFVSFVYPWPFYVANVKGLDDTTYNDVARWGRLSRTWYVTGRAYRSLDSIDGTPNPIFRRWLRHPGYDAYWRGVVPDGREFARITIPVLQTAGYYYGGPGGAVHYLTEHYRYVPAAEHYLVIGPYDHRGAQRGTVSFLGDEIDQLNGYTIDSAAHVDVGELRYQWFDYVFKGAPKPALLRDRINYQVMGANVWKHAPSLAAMSDHALRLHLTAARSDLVPDSMYRLSARPPERGDTVTLTVDLADRSDVDRVSPASGLVDPHLDTWNSVVFVSDPLPRPTEVSGLFSGRLEFVANKRDLDFQVSLLERTAQGEYVLLSYYQARASWVRDRGRRQLLVPGRRERLDFRSERLTSRRLAAGSRLVVGLSVIKQPDMQINYGTGKDPSDETIADAGAPLTIRWLGESYVDVPVGGGGGYREAAAGGR